MATQEQIQSVRFPSFITERQQQLLNTLFGRAQDDPATPDVDESIGIIGRDTIPPAQRVAGFTPAQLQAFQQTQQGLGSFLPFLSDADIAARQGLQTTGMATQALQGLDFSPQGTKQFMDEYQKDVTAEALKEIDRQAALAENRLAGQAAQAGAFGGSRFGVAQSELARNAQDLRSRRIFEDLSRSYQLAGAQQRAMNQQRMQAAQQFGNIGQAQTGIGRTIGQIGQSLQQAQGQDINRLLGIGAMQQQLAQTGFDVGRQNVIEAQQEPFRRLSFGSQILQGLGGLGGTTQQTISPMPIGNPFLQAAGAIGGLATGIGALIGN
jgi:hypothetical protein